MSTLSNQILKTTEEQFNKQGSATYLLMLAMSQGKWADIIQAFQDCAAKHGVKGDADHKGISTPCCTMRTNIRTVSAGLVGKPGYPFEGHLGVRKIDGVYTLVDAGPKVSAPKMNWARLADKFKTQAQKEKALASFKKALGL